MLVIGQHLDFAQPVGTFHAFLLALFARYIDTAVSACRTPRIGVRLDDWQETRYYNAQCVTCSCKVATKIRIIMRINFSEMSCGAGFDWKKC